MATAEREQTEVRAQARFVRTAPRKAQLVADQIRGRSVPEARTILAFSARDAARDIEKVLNSAVANAEANHGLVGAELVVSAAFIGAGPVLKRWRARARGRVARIRKRTCHITIRLAQTDGTAIPAARRAAPAAAVAGAPPAEETEKPRRGAKKAQVAATTEPPEAPEEKPKTRPKRAQKPKAAQAEAPEEAPTGGAEPEATEAKPKRSPRKKKPEEDS